MYIIFLRKYVKLIHFDGLPHKTLSVDPVSVLFQSTKQAFHQYGKENKYFEDSFLNSTGTSFYVLSFYIIIVTTVRYVTITLAGVSLFAENIFRFRTVPEPYRNVLCRTKTILLFRAKVNFKFFTIYRTYVIYYDLFLKKKLSNKVIL